MFKKSNYLFFNVTTFLLFIMGGFSLVSNTDDVRESNHDEQKPLVRPTPDVAPPDITNDKKAKKHRMVVFVHGTVVPLFSLRSLSSTLKTKLFKHDPAQLSLYASYLDKLRGKSVYKHQPIGPLGLHKITHEDSNCCNASGIRPAVYEIIAAYQAIYNAFFPEHDNNLLFYTFGWQGRLNLKHRRLCAEKFYHALDTEIARVKTTLQDNESLEVMVLAHSHGGNVSLHLAETEKKHGKNLSIDKLVLLGTPVQPETVDLIHEPLFKSIYHVYSRGDIVQVMDILSTKRGKSWRRFDRLRKDLVLPDKVTQLEISVGSKQPRHAELWFLGGRGSFLYRESLPIFPYPVAAFMPALVEIIDQQKFGGSTVSVSIYKKDTLCTFDVAAHDHVRKTNNERLIQYSHSLDVKNLNPIMGTILRE